ncbi:aminotransferase class V-fold PLP-dependent enzyme [Priestia megaterium]|nr:aminotransferase class V-fold PLP-dependent enzyme [Priestia megaterium]
MEEYHQRLLVTGNNWSEAMEKAEEARTRFAELIGAEAEEVAIVSSVSNAISAIATALPSHTEKNNIVFTDMDFPTVSHIWRAQTQFLHQVIRSRNGKIQLEQYEKEITANTLLTCVPHVYYYNGYKQDLKSIADVVHKKKSLLLVDAYQSSGNSVINVKEMEIDILITGTRKYMLGIPGVAFLYIKREVAEQFQPRVTGWLGQHPSSAFEIDQFALAQGAKRFETGTPSFISIYAANEAIKLLHKVGVSHIESYLEELTQFALNCGENKGLRIAGPLSIKERTSLTSFYVKNAQEAERVLRAKNILVSARKDVVRIAPHFYTEKAEIQYAIDELAKLE